MINKNQELAEEKKAQWKIEGGALSPGPPEECLSTPTHAMFRWLVVGSVAHAHSEW